MCTIVVAFFCFFCLFYPEKEFGVIVCHLVDMLWCAVVYTCEFVDDMYHPPAFVSLSPMWYWCHVRCVRLEEEFVERDMCECFRKFAVFEGENSSYAEQVSHADDLLRYLFVRTEAVEDAFDVWVLA